MHARGCAVMNLHNCSVCNITVLIEIQTLEIHENQYLFHGLDFRKISKAPLRLIPTVSKKLPSVVVNETIQSSSCIHHGVSKLGNYASRKNSPVCHMQSAAGKKPSKRN